MARKPKTQALAKWDEELAALVGETEEQLDHIGGGQFFSLAGGQLSINGARVPNDEVAVIIAYSKLENVYYTGRYDPDNSESPACYAFGDKESDMAPHDDASDKQAASCADCPMAQWGTADTGKGKACRNRIRLALVPCGSLNNGAFEPFETPDQIQASQMAYLNLSPTMLSSYAKYVKEQVKGILGLPVQAVFTKIKVEPHPKNQVQVIFSPLGKVPAELGPAIVNVVKAAKESIVKPYPKPEDKPKKPAKKARKKAGGKF